MKRTFRSEYRCGVVAMIDALGFRGIWNSGQSDPSKLVSDLADWAEMARKDSADSARETENWFYLNGIEPYVSFLSDTVFIGLASREGDVPWTPDQEPASANALALRTVMGTVLGLTRSAIRGQYPLAYRGCITYGKFAATDSFIIGPAVDEAAELHEAAEGAMVFLTPSALDLYNSEMPGKERDQYFLEYEVPLKGGGRYLTRVLNPLVRGREDEYIEPILKTFERRKPVPVRVAVLRQNTKNYLEYAKSAFHRPTASL